MRCGIVAMPAPGSGCAPSDRFWANSAWPPLGWVYVLDRTQRDTKECSGKSDRNRNMTLHDHTADDSQSFALPSLYTAKDLAARWNISVKIVHKLVREGKLSCVQVTARGRRFTVEQIQRYIEFQSSNMRVDKKAAPEVSFRPKKGGAKSSGVSGTGLAKEIRSLCRS